MVKGPVTEYQWEAYSPETGKVVQRGIIRTDYEKVWKSAEEIRDYISQTPDAKGKLRPLTPMMRGLEVRIMEREISPWVQVIGE